MYWGGSWAATLKTPLCRRAVVNPMRPELPRVRPSSTRPLSPVSAAPAADRAMTASVMQSGITTSCCLLNLCTYGMIAKMAREFLQSTMGPLSACKLTL